jgi:hypothetical protein
MECTVYYCPLWALSSIWPAGALLHLFLGCRIGPGRLFKLIDENGIEWDLQTKVHTFWPNIGPMVAVLLIRLNILVAVQRFTKVKVISRPRGELFGVLSIIVVKE